MSKEQEEESLHLVVTMLNDRTGPEDDWCGKSYAGSDVVRLRRLVQAWQKAIGVKGDFRTLMARMALTPEDRSRLEEFTKSIQVSFAPNLTLIVADAYPHPYDPALIQFTRLVRNSQNWRLGGPCPGVQKGKVCGKWFLRKDKHARRFCFGTCAPNAAKSAERERMYKKKLAIAADAIVDYELRVRDSRAKFRWELELEERIKHAPPLRQRQLRREIVDRKNGWLGIDLGDWKTAVSEVTGISKNFLTKAVKNGELRPPK